MTSETSGVQYRRQKTTGILTLTGIVDIFEAASLHASAMNALTDTKATTVRLDLTHAERLDLTALQILLTLRAALEESGRTLTVSEMPASLETATNRVGIRLAA